MCNDKKDICSCIFTILASLLVAAGISAVFYVGVIASIRTLVFVTLILGILGLLALIFKIFCSKDCNCINDSLLVPSTVGSIITSAFALAVTSLATFSIPVAILIGTVAFFLTSLLISLIQLLICIFCSNKRQYCNSCNN